MCKKPTISVIVPVYKVELYMDECIKSILSQDYTDFELILVDDGSPDRCGEKCDEYEKIDARVKVIHKDNGGLSDARNAGVAVSQGEYITFIDSDDIVAYNYLSALYNAATKYNADIVEGDFTKDVNRLGEKNGDIETRKTNISISSELFRLRSFYEAAVAKLYRRELVLKVPFPKGRFYEDVLTAYKFAFYAETMVFTHVYLYYYRPNPESIAHGPFENRLTVLSVFQEMEEFFKDKEQNRLITKEDLCVIRQEIKYYKFRTMLFIYNEGLGRNADITCKDAMSKLRKEILNMGYNGISLEIKYRILYHLLKISPKAYKHSVDILREKTP